MISFQDHSFSSSVSVWKPGTLRRLKNEVKQDETLAKHDLPMKCNFYTDFFRNGSNKHTLVTQRAWDALVGVFLFTFRHTSVQIQAKLPQRCRSSSTGFA